MSTRRPAYNLEHHSQNECKASPVPVRNMSRLSLALSQRVYRELGATEKVLSYWMILRPLLSRLLPSTFPSRLYQMLLAKLSHRSYNAGISRYLASRRQPGSDHRRGGARICSGIPEPRCGRTMVAEVLPASIAGHESGDLRVRRPQRRILLTRAQLIR